jgi:hypothetical protein
MEETIKISLRRTVQNAAEPPREAPHHDKVGRRFLQTAHFCDSDGVSTDLGFMQREAVTIGKVR